MHTLLTKRQIDIKNSIIENNKLIWDYTKHNDINYFKLLIEDIKQSIDEYNYDLDQKTNTSAIIYKKLKTLKETKNNENFSTFYYKILKIKPQNKNAQRIIQKINQKQQQLKKYQKEINKTDIEIMNFIKKYTEFIESKNYEKLDTDFKDKHIDTYNKIHVETAIMATIYSKAFFGIQFIDIINKELIQIDETQYCFEPTLDQIDYNKIHKAYKNILETKQDIKFFLK
jgi:hypothetical protein